jgi:hypothetical protein
MAKNPTLKDLNYYVEFYHWIKQNMVAEKTQLEESLTKMDHDPMHELIIKSQIETLRAHIAANAVRRDDAKIALIRYKRAHSAEGPELKPLPE